MHKYTSQRDLLLHGVKQTLSFHVEIIFAQVTEQNIYILLSNLFKTKKKQKTSHVTDQ